MTFDHRHYVPVLKVKRGEKRALQLISPTLQQNITPLLEIVERKGVAAGPIADHLNTAFKDLADSVNPYSRCFLDAKEIAPDGPAAAAEVFRRAVAEGITFTPVTGISRTEDTVAALSNRTNGLALRLTRSEFESGNLNANLQRFLSRYGLVPTGIDLIIDLGPVNEMISVGVKALASTFLASVPNHTQWRTLTVSACGFPSSMGVVGRNSNALVDRVDWMSWRDGLRANRGALARLPTFSDCAIQHSEGVEGFNPLIMKSSAAVRYTSADSWLLIKGVNTRLASSKVQFPALAHQLVYGELNAHYAGETHCEGCLSIKASADGAEKLGSLEVWRRLGTIHHLTTVSNDLSVLP